MYTGKRKMVKKKFAQNWDSSATYSYTHTHAHAHLQSFM